MNDDNNRSTRTRVLAASLVVACLIAGRDAGAQPLSTLTGTIRDSTGSAVAGATLMLETPSLPDTSQTTLSTARGLYRFSALPPGLYDVTASLRGMTTVKRSGLRISVGSTLTVDLVLVKAETPDVVTISGAGPVVDVTTAASTTRLTSEDLVNLPIEGGVAILQVVPGVTPRTAFGSGADTSQLTVDGGPVTFALRNSGARSSAVHVYWMEEVQIAGLGANAEFGEFSGVVANVALRSGSNRFSGLLEYRFLPSGWVADNTGGLPEELRAEFQPKKILSRWNSHAHIGGPIFRDRLFFFSGFEYGKDKVIGAGTIGAVPVDERSPAFLTKLTWAPGRDLKVEGFVEADETRQRGTLGRNALPETANDRTSRLRSGTVRAMWTVDPHTLLDVRTGAVNFTFAGIPEARRAGPAPRRDRVTGLQSGNVMQFQDQFGNRYLAGATFTRFLDGLGGSHTFKSGVEVERTEYRQVSAFPGGRSFTDAAGVPETVVLWAGDRVSGTGTRTTLFLQDAWNLGNRITLHPGMRASINRGSVPDKGSVFRTTPLSPRIGIAWDVSADHRTVVRANYGRLHEGLYTPLFDFMNTAERNPRITATVAGPETFIEKNRTTVADSVRVDDHLAHAYVDQYLAGVERELFADFSLALQYVGRSFGDIWALTDTGSQYELVQRPDPGPDGSLNTADDGGPVNVFNLLNPGQAFTLLTNPAGAFRRYHAFQAIGQKRFSGNWQLLGAYTWSKTRGNVNVGAGENRASGSDTGADGVFFNPNRRINAAGPISSDHTHQLNLQAVYVLPAWGGVGLSGTYRYLNGGAAGRTATITPLQQGNQTVRVEPRGTRPIDAASALDIRIEKTIPLGGSGRLLGIYADLLNVMNRGIPFALTIEERSGETFGEPTTWADPRGVWIGGRVKF